MFEKKCEVCGEKIPKEQSKEGRDVCEDCINRALKEKELNQKDIRTYN